MRLVWRSLAVLVLISANNALATLAFVEVGKPARFFWSEKSKVQYRECTVPEFTEEDLKSFATKILPTCEKDARKSKLEQEEGLFIVGVAAMQGIATRFFDVNQPENTIASMFLSQERALRSGGKLAQLDNEKMLRVMQMNDEVAEYLSPTTSKLYTGDMEDYFTVRYMASLALTPVYSNGRVAVTIATSVAPSKILSACNDSWAPMSLQSAKELLASDGQDFVNWVNRAYPKYLAQFLLWDETFTEKTVRNGNTAYVRSYTLPYYHFGKQTSAASAEKYVYPVLCMRREFKRAREGRPFKKGGTLTLDYVAKYYGLDEKTFYSKIMKDPLLEQIFVNFHLGNDLMREDDFYLVTDLLGRTLGTNLPDWTKAENEAIVQEQRQEQARKAAAALAAKQEAERQQRERQLAWERQQQEKRDAWERQQEENRRQQRLAQQRKEEAERRARQPEYARYTKAAPAYYHYGGRQISKATHDDMMDKYNISIYGHPLKDYSGNSVSKEDFDRLNRGPDTSNQVRYTVRQQQQVQLYYVQPAQTQYYLILGY